MAIMRKLYIDKSETKFIVDSLNMNVSKYFSTSLSSVESCKTVNPTMSRIIAEIKPQESKFQEFQRLRFLLAEGKDHIKESLVKEPNFLYTKVGEAAIVSRIVTPKKLFNSHYNALKFNLIQLVENLHPMQIGLTNYISTVKTLATLATDYQKYDIPKKANSTTGGKKTNRKNGGDALEILTGGAKQNDAIKRKMTKARVNEIIELLASTEMYQKYSKKALKELASVLVVHDVKFQKLIQSNQVN